jgi:hypothetical protein
MSPNGSNQGNDADNQTQGDLQKPQQDTKVAKLWKVAKEERDGDVLRRLERLFQPQG